MGRKRYTLEDIVGHLHTVDIKVGKGMSVPDTCWKLGICEQTYYHWKREYGGLRVDQAKQMKDFCTTPSRICPSSFIGSFRRVLRII